MSARTRAVAGVVSTDNVVGGYDGPKKLLTANSSRYVAI